MRSGIYLALAHSARGAQRHRAGNTRRETRDCRQSSFMHPSELPDHAADHPRPTRPTNPHKACKACKRARRSSSCTLLVVVETAGPVAG
eukprot:5772649-Prymnesium_polylepis.2